MKNKPSTPTTSPSDIKGDITFISAQMGDTPSVPLYEDGLRAGFPSPAQDIREKQLDLNHELIRHREHTFFATVQGDSMIDASIIEGDIVVVDRSLEPRHWDIVVACLNGEFTLKHLDLSRRKMGRVSLVAANKRYAPITIDEFDDFEVWGVVTSVIRRLRHP